MWQHPTEGRIFYIQNQWFKPSANSSFQASTTIDPSSGYRVYDRLIAEGPVESLHGKNLNGEPDGGYWITEEDMEYQCAHPYGDVNAFYDYKGFVEP